MARYPVLERPLAPGQVTLEEYAPRIGRTAETIRVVWRPRPGCPEPVGELLPEGRHGGGRGQLVFEEKALDAFRATQPDLWGSRGMSVVTTHRDLDDRVTLGEFAPLTGEPDSEVTRYQRLAGWPGAGPDPDGRWRLGYLVTAWNTRPLIVTDRDPDERITISAFAREVARLPRGMVERRRGEDDYPTPGPDGKYRLGELVACINNRAGKRGPGRAAGSRAPRRPPGQKQRADRQAAA